jgi:type II secretory pathway component PulM
MKPETLRQHWAESGPLRRALFACGTLLAGAALLYGALIKPAASAIAGLRGELPTVSAQSARLQALLGEVQALKSRPAAAIAPDPPAALAQSLAAAGLKAARVVPLADGALQVTFADVSYGAWSVWLANAERVLGMRTIAASARASSTPGHADIQLELQAGRE